MKSGVRIVLAILIAAGVFGFAYFASEDFVMDCRRDGAAAYRCTVTSKTRGRRTVHELTANQLRGVELDTEIYLDSDHSPSKNFYFVVHTTSGDLRSGRGGHDEIVEAVDRFERFRCDTSFHAERIQLNNEIRYYALVGFTVLMLLVALIWRSRNSEASPHRVSSK